MPNFEHKPEKDPQAYMKELKHGRFTMPEDEKQQIVEKARAEDRDPEEALREHQARLDAATGRLREKQKENAISDLEREMNRQLKDKKEKE